MFLSYEELRTELEGLGFDKTSPARDRAYFCPSEAWLRRFAAWCKKHTRGYLPEKYDCDNFALRTVCDATEALAANPKVLGADHAVLYCTLELRPPGINGIHEGSHATNLVRCAGGWFFFERQTAQVCPALTVRDRYWPHFVLL